MATYFVVVAGLSGITFVVCAVASGMFLKAGWKWALYSDNGPWPTGKAGVAAYLFTPFLLLSGIPALAVLLLRGFASQTQWLFLWFPPL